MFVFIFHSFSSLCLLQPGFGRAHLENGGRANLVESGRGR